MQNESLTDSNNNQSETLLKGGNVVNNVNMTLNQKNNIAYLIHMIDEQAELLHNTRSLLINSTILRLRKDNDELRTTVRIADNEMKIIMLTDQVK